MTYGDSFQQQGQPNECFFFANQGMGSKYTVMSYEKYVRRGAEFFDVVKQTFHGLGVANF